MYCEHRCPSNHKSFLPIFLSFHLIQRLGWKKGGQNVFRAIQIKQGCFFLSGRPSLSYFESRILDLLDQTRPMSGDSKSGRKSVFATISLYIHSQTSRQISCQSQQHLTLACLTISRTSQKSKNQLKGKADLVCLHRRIVPWMAAGGISNCSTLCPGSRVKKGYFIPLSSIKDVFCLAS